MNIIFACAGTGGHVTPALAIAKKIRKEDKDSNILFIGTTTGIENEMVTKEEFEIKHIRTDKLIRKITFKNVKSVYTNYLGYLDAKKIIEEFQPDLIVGTGGYICVPVMYAAKTKKVKYLLHEANAFPRSSCKTTC